MNNILDEIIKDSIPIWDLCINTEFVQEITDGSIDDKKVLKYIIEDTIYLREYAKCFAYAITKCNTLDEMKFFYLILGFVNEAETSVRKEFLKKHHFKDDEVFKLKPSDACKKYTDHMLKYAKDGSLEEVLCAILPCMLSYQYIFYKIYKDKPNIPNTKYYCLLCYYISEEYKETAKSWIDYSNKLLSNYKDNKKLKEIFRYSSLCELEFWKMSYEEK